MKAPVYVLITYDHDGLVGDLELLEQPPNIVPADNQEVRVGHINGGDSELMDGEYDLWWRQNDPRLDGPSDDDPEK